LTGLFARDASNTWVLRWRAVQVKRTLRRMASLFQLMRPLRRATQLELILHTWKHVRVVLLLSSASMRPVALAVRWLGMLLLLC
jgi:hypothetical protein